MRIKHENKIFKFTLIYFMILSLILFILESFENDNVWWTLWHALSNIVNFLVLATTIFLITLNNPIMIEQKKHKIKTGVYYIFQFAALLLTIFSPLTIINSDTQIYIKQLFFDVVKFHKLVIHWNLFELICLLLIILIFSILFFNAKIFSTQHKNDDDLIENKVTSLIKILTGYSKNKTTKKTS